MIRFLLAAAVIAAPAYAAAPAVALSSDVRVEKLVGGQPVLQPATHVVPGDRLVFRNSYRNGGAVPATRFRRHQSGSHGRHLDGRCDGRAGGVGRRRLQLRPVADAEGEGHQRSAARRHGRRCHPSALGRSR